MSDPGGINTRVCQYFGVGADSREWNDWHWQYAHRITDAETLAQVIDLRRGEKLEVTRCLEKFRMAVTPYYASLIDPADPRDPVRMQAVPSAEELKVYPWELADPLNEEGDSPVGCVVRRYPDRALLLVTKCCAMYCRHCTRRRLVGEEDSAITPAQTERAIEWLRDTPEIRDVLISGGDPLTLPDSRLEYILSRLRSIGHIEIIRIGTRVPVTMPMRVTPRLTAMLKKYHPLFINTHFNHPRELTPQAAAACGRIADAGIPLGNQSVLLRGINDSTGVMKELVFGLLKARVRPYYLYQCDLSEGLEHFRTDVREGIRIIDDLTGNVTGLAVPRFVIDAPGGGGKVPMNPEYIRALGDDKVVMRNYLGRQYEYPQPGTRRGG
jgi:lysine 2,3-aminomutase